MSLKLKEELDSRFNDISLISSKDEANQGISVYKQRQQTRILYLISFLTTMNHATSIALSTYILSLYLDGNDDKNWYNFSNLTFYNAFASCCASVMWGFVSDRVGRKTALNITLLGSALTMALYGFSKSLNSLAFINILDGFFGCSHIFIKTMLGESNEKVFRPNAFRFLPIIKMISSFLGPMITTPFFISHLNDVDSGKGTSSIARYHYLIPSLITSGISIAAYIVSYYCLSETLTDKTDKLGGPVISEKQTNQTMTLAMSKKISIFGLNFSKNSLLLLALSFLLCSIYQVYSVVSQSWVTADLSKGGLNLKIGHVLVVTPLSPIIMVTILLKYSYIHKNLGVLKQFKAGFPAVGVLFIFSLMLTLVAKSGSTFIVLSLYAILYSIKSGIDTLRGISFDLLLVESAEVAGNLGTLYGVSNIVSGISNVLSVVILYAVPYVFKKLSSISTEINIPFPLNWSSLWSIAILSLIGYWLSSKIEITFEKNHEATREHEL